MAGRSKKRGRLFDPRRSSSKTEPSIQKDEKYCRIFFNRGSKKDFDIEDCRIGGFVWLPLR